MKPLLLSIITPCLNRAPFVSQAVESVRQQDYPDVEHIVMDGGSTDGSLEILNRYSHLRVFSQPDKGIYDALNKGIRVAQGDVFGFLNTDDLYEPNILGTVAKAFTENPQVDAVVGGASIFSDKTSSERVTMVKFPSVPPGELLIRATVGAPIFNAWFFHRRLLEDLGGFNIHYRLVADRELLIRMAHHGWVYTSVDQPFYHYRMHSGSYTLSGEESGEAAYMFENRKLAENYLRRKSLSRGEKKHFKAWHSQIMMEQIITAVHKKALHRAIGYLLTGLLYDLGMLATFTREVSNWISMRFTGISHR